jgi:hypothetical protein
MRLASLPLDVIAARLHADIHRYRYVLLTLYSASLLAVLGLIAARRYFWYDELFTLLIASLPSDSAIWEALVHGAENQPPLNFWFVHGALPASKTLELSARLPSICSFWLMTLCVYRIVAKETNTTHGFIALLVPLTTPAVYFAYEARAYAPVLLFASASVLFWQMARSGERRPWSVALFFVALTAAAYCHFYGVLLFLPFALTELALGLFKKRWDRPIVVAILFAGVALVPLTRIVLTVGEYTDMFSTPSLSSVQGLYARVLGVPGVIFGLMAIGAGLSSSGQSSPLTPSRSRSVLTSRAGMLFLLIFCLLPVAGLFLARLATNAFTDRYFVFILVGFSIAFALMLYQQWGEQSWLSLCGLFVLILVAALEVRDNYIDPSYRASNSVAVAVAVADTRHVGEGIEPLLVSDIFYLPVYYYGSPELRQRLYFLDDNPAEHFSVAARRLAGVRPLAIVSLKEVFERYSSFYVYKPSPSMMQAVRRFSRQLDYVDNGLYYLRPLRPNTR